MTFSSNPARDASATIAGFVFQVSLTILRWLNLQDGEVLELECGEDIDTVRRELQAGTLEENRLLEQVKRRKSNLTLRSAAALESIANFCEHRHTNPGTRLQFRFVTTAHEGRENDWEGDANGIATWEAIRSGELSEEARAFSLERIRVLLRKAVKPDRIGERAWGYLQESLSPDERLNELIDEFEWGIESEDYPAIEHRVKHGLIQSRLAPNEEIAGEVLDRLFVSVFRTLSLAGPKRLTLAHLHAEVARKTESTADRDLMSFIRSGLVRFEQRIRGVEDRVSELEEASASAQAIISSLGAKENFTAVVDFTRPAVLLDVPELVVPSIRRTNAVQTILSSYSRGSTVSIVGEPGSGKTQLALLVAQQLGSSLVWVDIPRNATSQHACDAIDATLQSVAGLPPGPVMKPWYESVSRIVGNRLLVLDNVPRTMQGDQLTRRIEFLSSMLSARGGKLLTTSYYQLPRRTVESLSVAEIQAPRFSEEEVAELLVAYGSTGQLASQLTTLISTATQGLPILVAAVGRYLASRDWKFDVVQFDSIVKAEFARAARTDARELVQLTIPDGDTRELLYRLTLVIGGISRTQVERVARIPRVIPIPLEKLDRLLGLWIQPFVGDKYSISPLVDPGAADLLDESTRKGVHAILGATIMSRESIYPLDVVAGLRPPFHRSRPFGSGGYRPDQGADQPRRH